jgi:hypothetical protein
MKTLYRTLHPETRILDAKKGLVEYVASDETLDSYREIIRANGWKFSRFQKNAPFVDSHNYGSLDKLLGKVVDFAVRGKQLVETVQWAVDVADNQLAQLGWRMTEAGYLKAVSVGFMPVKYLTKWDGQYASDREQWLQQLKELGLDEQNAPRVIYTEQEQIELSACIIGANMNALAKSYKAGFLDDALLEKLSSEHRQRETASATDDPAVVAEARQRAQQRQFMEQFERTLKSA